MPTAVDEQGEIAWIQSELERAGCGALSPPLVGPDVTTTSLCEYVRDGRALCLLANALVDELDKDANTVDHTLPKKLERSMHQLSTFHSLERIQFFIKWCRNAVKLEEQHIFTSVQLLDEANVDAVGACITALRSRFRPKHDVASASVPDKIPEPSWRTLEITEATPDPDDDTIAIPIKRTSSSGPASNNKLNAFLSKFPSDTSTPSTPTTTTTTTTTERPLSTSKKNLFGFSGSRSSSDRLTTTPTTETPTTSTPTTPTPTAATSPRKLKVPTAFGGGGGGSTTTSPVKDTEAKSLSKLEIPSAFGRQRSLSNANDTNDQPSPPTDEPTTKPTTGGARSVSKLQIPAAFSTTSQQQPPSPKTVIPSSPRGSSSRLEIPSAFAKGSAIPSPQSSPKKDTTSAPSSPTKKRPPSKLSIPSVFGQTPPSPKKPESPAKTSTTPSLKRGDSTGPKNTLEKRASKLAAFLSTVEAANELTGSTSNDVVVQAEPVATAVAVVAEQPVVVAEPPVVVEEKAAPPVVETTIPVEPTAVEEEHIELERETKSAPRSSKLLAFLAAVEPTTPTPALPDPPKPEEPSLSSVLDGYTIVDPDGEVVHEVTSPRSAPQSPKKARSPKKKRSSPRKSDQQRHMESGDPVTTPVVDDVMIVAEAVTVPTTVPLASDANVMALEAEKTRLKEENAQLRAQVESKSREVDERKIALAELQTELDALQAKLVAQSAAAKTEREVALQTLQKTLETKVAAQEAEFAKTKETLERKAAQEKKDLEATFRVAQEQAEQTHLATIAALREQLQNQTDALERAKESEEAARFSAQMAFAARDEAEELSQRLQQQIDARP